MKTSFNVIPPNIPLPNRGLFFSGKKTQKSCNNNNENNTLVKTKNIDVLA